MRIPIIRGMIDRRILANYRMDPEVMARQLPAPFRPKQIHGYAMGGICLIRLCKVRPRFLPLPWGIRSENAAHRIAVEWEVDGQYQQGVYIPRRDTNAWLNTFAGGSLFPGIHHHAHFSVDEAATSFAVRMRSDDGHSNIRVEGRVAKDLPESSVFRSLAEASEFFAAGSLGYSATANQGRYDGLELRCYSWQVEPLTIDKIESSYFDDPERFPPGAVDFDCALLMRRIDHEWHGRDDLFCAAAVQTATEPG